MQVPSSANNILEKVQTCLMSTSSTGSSERAGGKSHRPAHSYHCAPAEKVCQLSGDPTLARGSREGSFPVVREAELVRVSDSPKVLFFFCDWGWSNSSFEFDPCDADLKLTFVVLGVSTDASLGLRQST